MGQKRFNLIPFQTATKQTLPRTLIKLSAFSTFIRRTIRDFFFPRFPTLSLSLSLMVSSSLYIYQYIYIYNNIFNNKQRNIRNAQLFLSPKGRILKIFCHFISSISKSPNIIIIHLRIHTMMLQT